MSDYFPIDKRSYLRYRLGYTHYGVLELPASVFGAKRQFNLIDISKEGLAFESMQVLPLNFGEVIPGCRVELYPLAAIPLNVTLRNRRPCLMVGGKPGYRYGCQTEGIQPKTFMQIRQVLKVGYLTSHRPRRAIPPMPPMRHEIYE